jgi:hypothetical protein
MNRLHHRADGSASSQFFSVCLAKNALGSCVAGLNSGQRPQTLLACSARRRGRYKTHLALRRPRALPILCLLPDELVFNMGHNHAPDIPIGNLPKSFDQTEHLKVFKTMRHVNYLIGKTAIQKSEKIFNNPSAVGTRKFVECYFALGGRSGPGDTPQNPEAGAGSPPSRNRRGSRIPCQYLISRSSSLCVPAGEHAVPGLASLEGLHLESEHDTACIPAPKAPGSQSNCGSEHRGRVGLSMFHYRNTAVSRTPQFCVTR